MSYICNVKRDKFKRSLEFSSKSLEFGRQI